jgi:hypothetical protein
MPRPELRLAAVTLALAAGAPAAAQDPARAVELRAHAALAAARAATEGGPAPFETDGCSGGLSVAWETLAAAFPTFAEAHGDRPPWEACCVAHDRDYHLGGPDPSPEASYAARVEADAALGACVRATSAAAHGRLGEVYGLEAETVDRLYDAVAEAMTLAVRVGGGPCSGLPWRWGYGWPSCTPFDD